MKKNLIKYSFLAMTCACVMVSLSACSGKKAEPIQEEILESTPEELPAIVQTEEPAEEEIPATEEAPAEAEIPVTEEEPAEEETPVTEEEPAEKETPVAEEEPAETVPASGFDRGRAQDAFARVNEQRSAAGLPALAWEEALYELACTRAEEITAKFSHERPDGSYVGAVILDRYGASGCGENIAANYQSITNLVNGWMNSQGHKENILDGRFNGGVMACYYCNGTYYWVNLFWQS